MKLFAAAIAASLFTTTALAHTPEEVAAAALEAAPVWDGHNDLPIQLRYRVDSQLADFDFHDTLANPIGQPGQQDLHTDLKRLREGRVGAQFWSIFVQTGTPESEAVQATLEQIDLTKRLVARYPDDLAIARTANDVERAMAQGKIASLMGVEGGHSIGSSLAVLRQLYDLGARYLTLTHSRHTPWADSASEPAVHGGLTAFGKDVVREMNRLGMLVDLSHVSVGVMHDALDVSAAPVIFSHTGAASVSDHERNVPDDVLARMTENGGVVMVLALSAYIDQELVDWWRAQKAEVARLAAANGTDENATLAGIAAWMEANPKPVTTVADVADHVDRIRQVAGIDHVGIGGDYDGMPPGPVGMEDVSGYPALFAELARRGYTQDDLEKIASRNMMRVMKAVEAHAASRVAESPLETLMPAAE